MKPIRVLLLDDDLQMHQLLAFHVGMQNDMKLLSFGFDEARRSTQILNRTCDVLIINLDPAAEAGLNLMRAVRARQPGAEVIVLSHRADQGQAVCSFEAGARGYILKSETPSFILESIRSVIGAGAPISPRVARQLVYRLVNPAGLRVARATQRVEPKVKPILTPKEIQVLQQVAKGYSYNEIARSLQLSIHTITSHIKNLFRKLAVTSRSEAVFEAIQLGLIRVERV